MNLSIAYLIIAHENPARLLNLISALSAPWVSIYVHIDAKKDITPFLPLKNIEKVTLLDETRVKVYWGGWSQVAATLALIRAALSEKKHDRLILLSGSCHPLFPKEYIRDFFNANQTEYLSSSKMPNLDNGKPLTRLTRWRLEGGSREHGLKPLLIKITNKFFQFALPPRNISRALDKKTPYAGSNWWALSADAAEEVLSETEENIKLVNLFKYSLCPDESYFQTILGNSIFADRLSPSLTYADWGNPKEQPATISYSHNKVIRELINQEKPRYLFIRKCNELSARLIEEIKDSLLHNPKTPSTHHITHAAGFTTPSKTEHQRPSSEKQKNT